MIRYRNEQTDLWDVRVPVSGTEAPRGGGGWRLLLLLVIATLITAGVLYLRR